MNKPNVTVIPPTVEPVSFSSLNPARKKRLAGYARVSSDSEEQENSFEAQVDYYTKLILANPEWELVKIYTDEGISATNTKKRDGFNEMIADALDGKIDLIITKSVIMKGQFCKDSKRLCVAASSLCPLGFSLLIVYKRPWLLSFYFSH